MQVNNCAACGFYVSVWLIKAAYFCFINEIPRIWSAYALFMCVSSKLDVFWRIIPKALAPTKLEEFT